MTIRPATLDDVPHVLTISQEHDLNGKSPQRVLAEGFLVSAYPAELYHRLLHRLTIADDQGSVAGFLLTFPGDDLPPEVKKDEERVRSVMGDRPFHLIKQVGVAIRFQRHKVGSLMYRSLLSTLTVPAFAPIVLAPENRNIVSIRFHESLGFRQAETLHDEHGREKSGLWCWTPPSIP